MRKFSTFILLFFGVASFASEGEGLMYSNEKIYVVVGVLLIIFTVLAAYLFKLDKRVKQAEKNNET